MLILKDQASHIHISVIFKTSSLCSKPSRKLERRCVQVFAIIVSTNLTIPTKNKKVPLANLSSRYCSLYFLGDTSKTPIDFPQI